MDFLRNQAIDVDPQIRSGIPVLKGTRVPVSRILMEIAENKTIKQVADDLDLDEDLITRFIKDCALEWDLPYNSVRINDVVIHIDPINHYPIACWYKGRLSEDSELGKKGDVLLRPVSYGDQNDDYVWKVSPRTVVSVDKLVPLFS